MKGYAMEKQDRVINGFTKVARQAEGPDFIARDMARTKEINAKIAKKSGKSAIAVPAVRISFYNPSNPLNGFKSKSKADQLAIKASMKK